MKEIVKQIIYSILFLVALVALITVSLWSLGYIMFLSSGAGYVSPGDFLPAARATTAAYQLQSARATLQSLTATVTPTSLAENPLATERAALLTLTPEVVTP